MNKLKKSEILAGIITLPLGIAFFFFTSLFILRDFVWSIVKGTKWN